MNGEFELIKKLSKILPPVSLRVETGIGDDTAVLKPLSKPLLYTVDTLVEGIHFDFSFCTPHEVGKKALAVNLSDIAAMGGTPRSAIVALGISKKTTDSQCEELYEGLAEEAKKFEVDIVGGNISQSPERFFISISLLGEAEGTVLRRKGAKPGDLIFVTGFLGEAAAGLDLLKEIGRNAIVDFPSLAGRYLQPEARCGLGQAMGKFKGITSLIDISDGLSSELWHLSEASRAAFTINEEALAPSSELTRSCQLTSRSALHYQLNGGGDYELLGTCSSGSLETLQSLAKKYQVPLVEIGTVSEGNGVFFVSLAGVQQPLSSGGWNHLGPSSSE